MSSTWKTALLLTLALAMLATPAIATARSASAPERQIVVHSKRPVSFYRESLREQQQIDARFYSPSAAPTGGDSHALRYALLACLALLAVAGAGAAWQLERSEPQPRLAAAH